MKRSFVMAAALCALFRLAAPLCAQAASLSSSFEFQGDYLFPNLEAVDRDGLVPIAYGVRGSKSERQVGSSWGGAEAKAIVAAKLVIPALAGSGELTKGNNLTLNLGGELSPVSLNATIEASFTPIAFLSFSVGTAAGTGWDIGFTGLGKNVGGDIVAEDFGGIVYRGWASGTFQFDAAALAPGDWHHVVLLASPKLEYKAYTNAATDEAWIWEADDAMNFNGWKLHGSYFLGYQMPLALNMAGVLLETHEWLGSVRDSSTMDGGWGSDFTWMDLSLVLNFSLDGRSSIAIVPQVKSKIDWTDGTTMSKDFRDRVFTGRYWYFNRVAFDYTLEL
jgi:hypothetical protein